MVDSQYELWRDVTPLSHAFYLRDALDVARELLACALVHRAPDGLAVGRISETEAYKCDDPASHSFRGRTERNASMYLQGGHAYVYRSYGVHFCFNVVTGRAGQADAVLIRAAEPLAGLERMAERRGLMAKGELPDGESLPEPIARRLCAGPGNLCRAFGIDNSLDGADLTEGERLLIVRISGAPREAPVASARIGISQGRSMPWRFTLPGDKFRSRP